MRVLLFTLLMGPLLLLPQRGGGVAGLLEWVGRSPRLQTPRGAQLAARPLGLGVFIESTTICLVVGAMARPAFDRLRIARENALSVRRDFSAGLHAGPTAGVVVLSPLVVFLAAVPLNFHAVLSVGLTFVVAVTGWNIGPTREAERRATDDGDLVVPGARPVVSMPLSDEQTPPRARNLIIPLVILVVTVVVSAVLGGGVFGDHCSPISDTTRISSMAT